MVYTENYLFQFKKLSFLTKVDYSNIVARSENEGGAEGEEDIKKKHSWGSVWRELISRMLRQDLDKGRR